MTSVDIIAIGITIALYTGSTVAFASDIRVFRIFYIYDSILT